jgi:hypothetical protein
MRMQLMHAVGVTIRDQWFSDSVETDWRYVEGYYQTDKFPDWKSCNVSGCPLVPSMVIPELRSIKFRSGSRFNGNVRWSIPLPSSPPESGP